MQQKFRLHRSNEIQRVRRIGKSYAHPLIVLIAARNEGAERRLAVTVSRTVGNAVIRNRVRRRIREIFRDAIHRVPAGWDLLLVARPKAADAEFHDLLAAVDSLLVRSGWKEARDGSAGNP
jgi:ribonuclease P protein component